MSAPKLRFQYRGIDRANLTSARKRLQRLVDHNTRLGIRQPLRPPLFTGPDLAELNGAITYLTALLRQKTWYF